MPRNVLLLVVVIIAFNVADAGAVISQRWECSPVNIEGTDYIVNDLYITDDRVNTFVGVLELVLDTGVPGGIYQNPLGGIQAPNGAVAALFPDVAYDSFVTVGNLTDGPALIIPGLAVDLPTSMGGMGPAIFDDQRIDIAWASPPADRVLADDAVVLRLTLRQDVAAFDGELWLSTFTAGPPTDVESIATPVIFSEGGTHSQCVPESATVSLALLCLLSVSIRRRKKSHC